MIFSLLQRSSAGSSSSSSPTTAAMMEEIDASSSSVPTIASVCSALPSPSSSPTLCQAALLAGQKAVPIIQQLSETMDSINRIGNTLLSSVHPFDIIVLILLGFYAIPISSVLYYTYLDPKKRKPFNQSLLSILVDHISQVSRIGIVIYVFDFMISMLSAFGVIQSNVSTNSNGSIPNYPLTKVITKIVYLLWIAQRLSVLKRFVINNVVAILYSKVQVNVNSKHVNINSAHSNIITSSSKRSNQISLVMILDRLFDTLIYIGTCMIVFDIIDTEFKASMVDTLGASAGTTAASTTSIRNILAVGSATTLLLGLAAKDIATMIVNGYTLSTTDRIAIGDDIKFGDGTTGVIQNIGWIQTTIRHYDNIIEFVPNSILGMQRVKNISRTNQCRVQQTLRFHYEDALKLPKILDDIIDEIKQSCPELISDGSRPLRAVWTDYCETYLKVVVTAHFNIKPIGKKFCQNRQQCLLAIFRAVQKNNVQFVTTLNLEHTPTKKGFSPNDDYGSCR